MVKISQTDDLDAIREMDAVCFPGEDQPEFEDATWWIAHDGPAEVAYAGGIIDDGTDFFLNRAGVLPEARGHGLQRRLIRVRYRYARAHGLRSCYTYTVPTNPTSSNNLIRCGFRLFTPCYHWAREDCLYWYRAVTLPPTVLDCGLKLCP